MTLIAGVSLGFIYDTVLTVESIDMIVLALGVLYLGFLIWRHRSRKHGKRKGVSDSLHESKRDAGGDQSLNSEI